MNLAIFDLDHTLISCDTEVCWIDFLHRRALLDDDFLQRRDALFDQYADGSVDADEFVRFQLSSLTPFKRRDLEALYPEFLQTFILPAVYPQALELVDKHRRQSDRLLLLSASNEFLIRPIAAEFGISHIIGVIPEEDGNGGFSGNVCGTASFREGKITRLHQWLAQHGRTLNDFGQCWFYSDSVNDLPLLHQVNRPVAVNPDPKLAATATAQGWPVLHFAHAAPQKAV